MNRPLHLFLLAMAVFTAPYARAADTANSAAPSAAARSSMLSDFFDPELRFAEGCGCYLKRADATQSDGLVFFGKLGDQKESGWISLRGELMEIPKERPHSSRTEAGEKVLFMKYRSPTVAIQVELMQQEMKEETATYIGELTVSSDGLIEKIEVAGECGC